MSEIAINKLPVPTWTWLKVNEYTVAVRLKSERLISPLYALAMLSLERARNSEGYHIRLKPVVHPILYLPV